MHVNCNYNNKIVNLRMKYFTKENSPTFQVSEKRWEENKEHYLREGYRLVEKPKEEKAEKPPKSVAPAKK